MEKKNLNYYPLIKRNKHASFLLTSRKHSIYFCLPRSFLPIPSYCCSLSYAYLRKEDFILLNKKEPSPLLEMMSMLKKGAIEQQIILSVQIQKYIHIAPGHVSYKRWCFSWGLLAVLNHSHCLKCSLRAVEPTQLVIFFHFDVSPWLGSRSCPNKKMTHSNDVCVFLR